MPNGGESSASLDAQEGSMFEWDKGENSLANMQAFANPCPGGGRFLFRARGGGGTPCGASLSYAGDY